MAQTASLKNGVASQDVPEHAPAREGAGNALGQRRERVAAQQIEQLQEATAELAVALSASQVADVLLSVSERVLGAAAGVVYLTRQSENKAYLAGARGLPPLAQLAELTIDDPLPLARALKDRKPAWIESYAELIEQYPALSSTATPRDRLQAVVALPLLHAGRLVGGFALSFNSPRSFEASDRRWLSSFSTQCALAAERARLYEAEREARQEAETLLRISESMSATTLDLDALVRGVTDEATALVGANFGAFFYNVVSDAGESYMLYALSGAPKEAFAKFGLPRNTPIFSITFAGEGILRLDDVRKDPRYGTMAPHYGMPKGHLPVVSYLAVPVVSRSGAVLGGLFFGHREPGRFTEQHERMVAVLAASAGAAIDNATLFKTTKLAEQNQRRLVDELTETVRLNELLAGVLAHDLRNPLSAILNSAQLALRRDGSDDAGKFAKPLKRIVSSGERMSRMIEQLLDFTRIRVGGGVGLETKPVDLASVVRRVMEELEGAHPDVSFRLEPLGDTWGTWDEDRLSQALSNLLGNAVQHGIRDSGVHVMLDGRNPEVLVVTVHNMGAIPAETIDTLFIPLGRRAQEKPTGLGLGLFITREIARAHGGTVDVASTEATGTRFSVTLPREKLVANSQAATPPQDSDANETGVISPWESSEQFGESGQKFRLLVESVKDYAIFMLDPSGRVATWNAGAERIKGYKAREIIGQHFSRFYEDHEAQTGICERELEIASHEGRFEAEGFRLRKDGTRFWANVVITALRRPNGDLFGFAKVTRDLTERKKLEEEHVRRAQAEEALRMRDEFLSVVSHEFKTPLSVMQLQIEVLSTLVETQEPRFAKNIERARRSGDQLLWLVDSVLEVTRIATGTFALECETFELAEAVDRAVNAVRTSATLAGCELVVELERPILGSWDRKRVERVVTHLLLNAIIYAAGAPIRVHLERRADVAVLGVQDGGPGIAQEYLQRIFGRFERASSMRHHAGLGLGLYIAREVAHAHGGSVGVDSSPGRGAHFQLHLPIGPSVQARDEKCVE